MKDNENLNSYLAHTTKEGIQKYNSNPAIQLIGGLVELDESLKTFITAEKIKSSVISIDHKAWSKYDRQKG